MSVIALDPSVVGSPVMSTETKEATAARFERDVAPFLDSRYG